MYLKHVHRIHIQYLKSQFTHKITFFLCLSLFIKWELWLAEKELTLYK